MNLFRNLRADEIEVRLGQVNSRGMTLLLYKDARCDQNILDETFGADGWVAEVRKEEGTFITRLYIRPQEKDNEQSFLRWRDWPCKEGVGSAGNFEPEKSAASDSLKRAASMWGLGRELYTAPRITCGVPTKKEGNRYVLENYSDQYGWSVAQIGYDESGKINALKLAKDGKIAWLWGEVE